MPGSLASKLRLLWRVGLGEASLLLLFASPLLYLFALVDRKLALELALTWLTSFGLARVFPSSRPRFPLGERLALALRLLPARGARGLVLGRPREGLRPALVYDLERERYALWRVPEEAPEDLPALLWAAFSEARREGFLPCPGALAVPWGVATFYLCPPGRPGVQAMGLWWWEPRLLRVGSWELWVEAPFPLGLLPRALGGAEGLRRLFRPPLPPGVARRLLEAPVSEEMATLMGLFLKESPASASGPGGPSGHPPGG
jgi:hypothetical protein